MSNIIQRTRKTVISPSGTNPPGATGMPGTPGGNVMAIGTREDGWSMAIPAGTALVQTTGAVAPGVGHAQYIEDAALTPTDANNFACGFEDTNGRRFRITREQRWMPQQFYQPTDAHIGFAVKRALDYINDTATAILGGWGGGHLFFPKSDMIYECHDMGFEVFAATTIEGECGHLGYGGASILHHDNGVTAFTIERYNTHGASSYDATPHNGGDGTIIKNLALTSDATPTGPNAPAHGISFRARGRAQDVAVYNFQGDAFHVFAVAGAGAGGGEGNSNLFTLIDVTGQSCQNALFVDGPDTNAGKVIGLNGTANRRWCSLDSAFLNTTYLGCHADAGALFEGGKAVASLGGNLYTVNHGQEVGASTNAPSGTTAHNTWWSYFGAGGPADGYGRRAWVSGMTWLSGGAYCTDEPNSEVALTGCYSESGQAPSQLTYPTQVYGGMHAAGCIRLGFGTVYGGNLVANHIDGLEVPRDFLVQRNLQVNGDLSISGFANLTGGATVTGNFVATGNATLRGGFHQIGPVSGSLDLDVQFLCTGTYNTNSFYTGGVLRAQVGTIGTSYYVIANLLPETRIWANGALVGTFDSGSLNLAAGKVLKINGVTVLTAQMAFQADSAATDVAGLKTDLNSLLGKLRGVSLMAAS